MSKSSRPRASSRVRRPQTDDAFIHSVRAFMPAARRILINGVDGDASVEETIEPILKKRGVWHDLNEDNSAFYLATSRQSFLLGVALGLQLNANVLRGVR